MECQVCLQRFETEGVLQAHVESRVQRLLAELQQYLSHYTILKIPHTKSQALADRGISPDERRNSSQDRHKSSEDKRTRKKRSDARRAQKCPHEECAGKRRRPFPKHSNLNNIRLDIGCDETCPLCGVQITRVNHLDKCKKQQEEHGPLSTEQSSSVSQLRQRLTQAASAKLEEELSTAEDSDGDTRRGTKRQREVSSDTSGPRKRRMTDHSFGADGAVGVSSYTVAEDAATCPDGTRRTSSSTRSMASNGEHEVVSSRGPGHRLPNTAAPLVPGFENVQLASEPGLTGNSAGLEFGERSSMRAPFATSRTIDQPLDRGGDVCSQARESLLSRAPFASLHTMDHPRQQDSLLSRAPFASLHTMDHPLQQDPLTSYTMDGTFSNPGQYSAQATEWGHYNAYLNGK